MTDKNIFGGGNPNSLYFPMSETEQEALDRIFERDDLVIHVKAIGPLGYSAGVVEHPRITHGDARVQVPLEIVFSSPETEIPIYTIELALQMADGHLLFKKEYSALYQGHPMDVKRGTFFEMVWDFTIQEINPELVKAVKPGAIGLTTRVGNTHFDPKTEQVFHQLRTQEASARKDTQQQVDQAHKRGQADHAR